MGTCPSQFIINLIGSSSATIICTTTNQTSKIIINFLIYSLTHWLGIFLAITIIGFLIISLKAYIKNIFISKN
jgi:hypothetical protein